MLTLVRMALTLEDINAIITNCASTFGEVLQKTRRNKNNMSRSDLARATDQVYGEKTIESWELGARFPRCVNDVVNIAVALGHEKEDSVTVKLINAYLCDLLRNLIRQRGF